MSAGRAWGMAKAPEEALMAIELQPDSRFHSSTRKENCVGSHVVVVEAE